MDNKKTQNNSKEELKQFPYKIAPIDPDVNSELLKYFHGERTGYVQVGPEKYFFPIKYQECAEKYYNFKARPDDIWIVTFPRSGTTWTQELIWLIANDLNFDAARKEYLSKRFAFYEFSIFFHDEVKEEILVENSDAPSNLELIEFVSRPGYETFAEMKTRRFIKTHFPFSLLPPSVMEQKCKIIYLARNPRDVAVSFYYLNRLFRTQGYVGDFSRYWDYFEKGLNPWMPYWSHVKEGWNHRNSPNVLFMFYEDINKDFKNTITKVAQFLDKTLNDEEVDKLTDYLSIENFKSNAAVNGQELIDAKVLNDGEEGFVRRGKVDGWQSEYTPELRAKAETWITENTKKIDGLEFPEI